MNLISGYSLQILQGTWLTIQLALCALFFGLIFGLFAAIIESSKYRLLSVLTTGLISVIRGLPELVVIFVIYFGGTLVLTNVLGHYVDVSAFWAGTVALALIFGAYSSQVFRGAFKAIPFTQTESSRALGLNRRRTFFNIILPQAWRHAIPGLSNLWLVLLKDTALISLIGLPDLMSKSQVAASATRMPFVFYLIAAFLYLLLTAISERGLNFLSKQANRYLI